MLLVLFEFGPDQKLEVTQDSSSKCLGQPAQISLDSAVLAVRPAIIDQRRVQSVLAIFQLMFHQPVSVQCCVSATSSRNRHVATCCLRSLNKWSDIYFDVTEMTTTTCHTEVKFSRCPHQSLHDASLLGMNLSAHGGVPLAGRSSRLAHR